MIKINSNNAKLVVDMMNDSTTVQFKSMLATQATPDTQATSNAQSDRCPFGSVLANTAQTLNKPFRFDLNNLGSPLPNITVTTANTNEASAASCKRNVSIMGGFCTDNGNLFGTTTSTATNTASTKHTTKCGFGSCSDDCKVANTATSTATNDTGAKHTTKCGFRFGSCSSDCKVGKTTYANAVASNDTSIKHTTFCRVGSCSSDCRVGKTPANDTGAKHTTKCGFRFGSCSSDCKVGNATAATTATDATAATTSIGKFGNATDATSIGKFGNATAATTATNNTDTNCKFCSYGSCYACSLKKNAKKRATANMANTNAANNMSEKDKLLELQSIADKYFKDDGYFKEAQNIIKKFDINVLGPNNMPLLHYAARAESFSVVKMLLELGADVDAKDSTGKTALHYASEKDNFDIVEMLMYFGADINAKDNNEKTIMHYAIDKRNEKIAELVLELVRYLDNNENDANDDDAADDTSMMTAMC